ncbi:MAG: cupin domain-containing protein, partial [Planctomycetota bacterium]
MKIRSWDCHPDFPYSDDTPICGCWEYELKQGERTPPHEHSSSQEINVALEGSGRITVAEETRDLQPGAVIFIPAQASHYMENVSSPLLRGFSLEIAHPQRGTAGEAAPSGRISERDLDSLIEGIPKKLDETESLQLIIRLFDLAGYLSEQIEEAIGLESETGYQAMQQIERRVMEAVVHISRTYEGGGNLFFPKR